MVPKVILKIVFNFDITNNITGKGFLTTTYFGGAHGRLGGCPKSAQNCIFSNFELNFLEFQMAFNNVIRDPKLT